MRGVAATAVTSSTFFGEVKTWRDAEYPNTTRVTRELLHFWFTNDERDFTQWLFFAQQEAIETAII